MHEQKLGMSASPQGVRTAAQQGSKKHTYALRTGLRASSQTAGHAGAVRLRRDRLLLRTFWHILIADRPTMHTTPMCYMPCANSDGHRWYTKFCAHSHCWCLPMRETLLQTLLDLQSCLSYHGRAKLAYLYISGMPSDALGCEPSL